ncbi:MAG: diacylglycerol kinase family protein [Longimicrobiales bacterium]|nr:diacylglycerol kinase family protein [Longimicrobiales bacterium]
MNDRQAPSYLLIVNPVSGRGGGRTRARALSDALSRHFQVEVAETRGRGDAVDIAGTRGMEFGRVIAVGGDGTLNEVLTGLWRSGRPPDALPELGFLPSGTANAAAPAFGLRREPTEVAQALVGAPSRPVDFGVVRSSEGERPFLLWCGAGYDAVVIDALNSSRTGRMGILGLVRNTPGVVRRIAAYRESPVEAEVDGARWPELGGVVVANVADIAFGGTIAAGADPFDGSLDVVAVPVGAKARLPLFGMAMLSSGLQAVRGARFARATTVGLRAPGPVPVQIDGEPAGHLPIDVRVVAGGVRLLLT